MKSMRLRIIGFGVITGGKPNKFGFPLQFSPGAFSPGAYSPGAKRSVEKDCTKQKQNKNKTRTRQEQR